MTAEWRTYAKPSELAEHDVSLAQDLANVEIGKVNAARRKIIRNRCRMRGKGRADGSGLVVLPKKAGPAPATQ
jgi:hypothetical protein